MGGFLTHTGAKGEPGLHPDRQGAWERAVPSTGQEVTLTRWPRTACHLGTSPTQVSSCQSQQSGPRPPQLLTGVLHDGHAPHSVAPSGVDRTHCTEDGCSQGDPRRGAGHRQPLRSPHPRPHQGPLCGGMRWRQAEGPGGLCPGDPQFRHHAGPQQDSCPPRSPTSWSPPPPGQNLHFSVAPRHLVVMSK